VLWACLRFPQLTLDALRLDADSASPSPKPRAVIDGPQQRRHIVLADAVACRHGVRAGQALATAQVLCPRLAILPRDEAAERQALESLAAWAYRFSAEIHLAAPDAIFIEIGASLNLFGGWPALERRLRHELARLGFAYTLAAAPTAAAAQVLATHADGIAIPAAGPLALALGGVPIVASGLAAKTIAALQGMGFRQLRDLFPLPRAELTRRIGEEALAHLDRMRGLVAETLPRWQPPARFERRIEFSYGVESHTALAFPLQRLIRELALFLVARDGGVQRFTLTLGHERGASTCIEVGLLAPQRDAASLFELARARLERIELVAPVHALGLCADDLPPLCPLHRDLFDDRRRERLDWPALAERLRARLGNEALHGLAEVADHRPGRAWRFVPALDGSAAPAKSRSAPAKRTPAPSAPVASSVLAVAKTKPRPFWLLRQPILLRGTPTRILAGPERIESGWWDGHDYRRDYYIVETRLGQRAWAYVEAGETSNWTLHGWFA
jgi:protein ImuB